MRLNEFVELFYIKLDEKAVNKLKDKIVQNHGQLIPFDSNTVRVPLDIYYEYYRFIMQLGPENDFTEVVKGTMGKNKMGKYAMISFYTPQERERFDELCKLLNVSYLTHTHAGEKEDDDTNKVSPVPSSSFRDIDVFK